MKEKREAVDGKAKEVLGNGPWGPLGLQSKILQAQWCGQKNLRNKGCVRQNKCHLLFGASFFHL